MSFIVSQESYQKPDPLYAYYLTYGIEYSARTVDQKGRKHLFEISFNRNKLSWQEATSGTVWARKYGQWEMFLSSLG
jgi:hypothetical protein